MRYPQTRHRCFAHLAPVTLPRSLPYGLSLSVDWTYLTSARLLVGTEGLDAHHQSIWRGLNMPMSEARASEVLPTACDITSALNMPFLVNLKLSHTCER